MTKLAESSGTIVAEAGSKLYISKKPATWISVFLFVTGLLAIILLANGILQLTIFKDNFAGSKNLALILIGIALVFFIIFWRVRTYQKKINGIPLQQLKTICIFDFQNNNLLDENQQILTSIDKAWLTRKMQISSSSPELIIQ